VQLMRQDEVAATLVSENKTIAELRDFIRGFAPDLVCISVTVDEALAPALELVRALRTDSEQIDIMAGGLAAIQNDEQLRQAGCSQVCASIGEARRAIRSRIAELARIRRLRWSPARRVAPSKATPSSRI